MAEEDDDKFRASLPEKGEAKVKMELQQGAYIRRHRAIAIEWLNEQELARVKANGQLTEASYKESRRSADASERAASASERAATWAMWAVIAGVVAVVVSLFK